MVFAGEQIDGNTLETVQPVDLHKVLPMVPFGHLVKIYTAFQKKLSLSSETSTDVACINDNQPGIKDIACCDSGITSVSTCNSSFSSVDANGAVGFLSNMHKHLPEHFPIQACQFDINAKNLLRTGKSTRAGKRAVVTALLAAMRTYERYIC